jgi:hypothetical protein
VTSLPSCTGEGGTGTRFTYAQLQALWINAGGSQSTAPIAAAIAMAESSGCSAALNSKDNGGKQSSWGLWQISDGTHNQPVQGILTPTTNASAAVAKWRGAGGSFDDWGSYTSGSYRRFVATSTTPDYAAVPVATAADVTPVSAGAGDTCAVGVPAITLSFAPDFPGFCIISKSQARRLLGSLLVIGGAVVFLAGLAVVTAGTVSETRIGRSAASTVDKTVKVFR